MRSLQQHAELRFFGKLLLKIITIEIRKKNNNNNYNDMV